MLNFNTKNVDIYFDMIKYKMKHKCYISSCKALPDFFCKCEEDPELICRQHLYNHTLKDTFKIHKLIPAYKKVKNDSKDSILAFLKNYKNQLGLEKNYFRIN